MENEKEDKKETLKDILISKAVIITVITTVFGYFGGTSISDQISEKRFKYEVVSALMEYTRTADLNKPDDIQKLMAFVNLIENNNEMEVSVKGYQDIIDNYRQNAYMLSQEKLSELGYQYEQSKKNIEKLKNQESFLNDSLKKLDKKDKQNQKSLNDQITSVKITLQKEQISYQKILENYNSTLLRLQDSEKELLLSKNNEVLVKEKLDNKNRELENEKKEKERIQNIFEQAKNDKEKLKQFGDTLLSIISNLNNKISDLETKIKIKDELIENEKRKQVSLEIERQALLKKIQTFENPPISQIEKKDTLSPQ